MSFMLKLLWAILFLCIAILVAATAGLTIYEDELESKISSKVEEITGRELHIQQGFGFKFSPLPTVYAKDIVFANADWGTKPWMLKIKKVEAAFSFVALAQGKLKISDIKIDSPYFLFERKQGTLNWFLGGGGEGRNPKPLEKLHKYLLLDQAVVENAQFDIRINPRTHFINLNRVTAQVQPNQQTITLDVVGSAEDRVIQAKGTFDSVESMLLRQTSEMQLAGTYGEMTVSARGTIADILRWQGLNVSATVTVPSLRFFQPWNRAKLPETPPINGTADLLQPKRWPSARLKNINISMVGYGGETAMRGEFTDLPNWEGLSLTGISKHQALPVLEQIGWRGDSEAQLEAEFELNGDIRNGLKLDLKQGTLRGQGIDVTAQGSIDNLSTSNSTSIFLKAQASSLDQIGHLVGRPWPVTDAIYASAELAKIEGCYGLKNIDAKAYKGQVTVTGTLNNIGPFAKGRFRTEGRLSAPQLERLNTNNGYKLPLADNTQFAATIDYVDKTFQSGDTTQLKLELGEATIKAVGAIENYATLQIDNAKVTVDAPSVAQINVLYETKLPELGHLTAQANLSGLLKQKYALRELIGKFNSANHTIDIKGNVTDLGSDLKTHIDAVVKANKFDEFQSNLELALPQDMGAEARFKLISAGVTDWSIVNLEGELKSPDIGQFSGAVLHFPSSAQYQLDIDAKNVNVGKIPQLISIDSLKQRNIDISAAVSTLPGGKEFAASKLDIQVKQPGSNAQLALSGTVGDIAQLGNINLNGHLVSNDINAIPEFSKLDLKQNLPFTMDFNLKSDAQAKQFNFDITQLKLAQSDLAGTVQYKIPQSEKELPYLSANLTSKRLDIINLQIKTQRKRLFSETPLSLDWAQSINASIDIKVGDLNSLIANIKNAQTTLKIDQGYITFPGVTGNIGEGELTFWFAVDANSKPYNIISSMYGTGLDSKALNLFGDSGLIKDGLIDVDLGVSGQGVSLAQMMSNAYGKLQLKLNNASIKNQNLELFGSDLILGFLNTINPLSRQDEYLEIECGVIHFPINNGKAYADQGIAIKTDRVTVLGGGEINLNNEALKILIKPKARKGFGLSAGTIAKIIQIGGTINKPKIEVATSGFFSTAASLGLAAVSGGWTLLAQGLLERNKANSDVCNQTLKSPVFVVPASNRELDKSANTGTTNK